MIQIDHYILGVPDLEDARNDFHRKVGVHPMPGGQHPSLGTHNALVSLGDCYFELVAIDQTLSVSENPIIQNLKRLRQPCFIGWAIQVSNFDEVREVLNKLSLSLSQIGYGSRRTPTGEILSYEYALIEGIENLGCAVPFFVKWVDTVHPSVTSPKGCSLSKASLSHRRSEKLDALLRALALPIEVSEGAENKLLLHLAGAHGLVSFG